jgi:hypothetical protein
MFLKNLELIVMLSLTHAEHMLNKNLHRKNFEIVIKTDGIKITRMQEIESLTFRHL